jgi:hypothetical protein
MLKKSHLTSLLQYLHESDVTIVTRQSEALRHLYPASANGTGSIIGSYAYLNQVIRYCRFARRKASSSVPSRDGSVGATGSGARRPVPTDRPTRRPVTPWRTAASGRRSPPWATLEGCTAGSESLRVYTRSARRRGRWSVHVWSARTHTGVATMVPCTTGARPTHAVCTRHTGHLHHHARG